MSKKISDAPKPISMIGGPGIPFSECAPHKKNQTIDELLLIRGDKLLERWPWYDPTQIIHFVLQGALTMIDYTTHKLWISDGGGLTISDLTYNASRPSDMQKRMFSDLLFRKTDIEEFEKKPDFKKGDRLCPGAKQDQAQKEEGKAEGGVVEKPVEMEAEDFVRKLKVFYESNSEIKIQLPGKTAIAYNHAVLGFRDSGGQVWSNFLSILEDPDNPTYYTGTAYGDKAKMQRKKSYDVARKRLEAMNNKLIAFFKKEYGIQFPKKYKLYEQFPSDGPGIYRFKFRVGKRNEYGSERLPPNFSREKNEHD